ncbi:uncharacterized protein LOC114731805 isoform X2 [Neltuma alba]|uniref:uncharacterized protein LOC114731805 isoform X2 n=1 Tax=Neltuma alba TaxID=207710 RepID=UPI0010A3A80D|nr:uncharacterized protein LOC114731805 isoform X2 [Prosopis alba]
MAPELTAANENQQTVIAHKLNGSNYLQWSQSVLMYLRGRRKEKYINGQAPQPASDDPKFDTWFAENNQVMTWLCNSMTLEISEGYLLAQTAQEIWNAAKRTYSSMDNTAALFQLKKQLRELKQGTLTVTQYYSSLMRIWQQLDLFEVHSWKCLDDTQYYKKLVETERTYEFLLGLNDTFEEVRGRIMGLKPIPSLFEAFNMVKCEESRKQLTQTPVTQNEASAMAVKSGNTTDQKRKGDKWCEHCNKRGHTKEICWKLHGKPSNLNSRQRNERKSYHTEKKEEEEEKLSPEEVQLLRRILEKQTSTPNVNLVKSGFSLGEDDWQG